MSFIRPGAQASLRRWGESGVVALLLALAAWMAATGLFRGAGSGWVGLAAAALLVFWLRAALAKALARQAEAGPGVVLLREGEVGYMGPESGGFMDLREIQRIEILRPSRGGTLWYLDAGAGGRLVVPASAEGAERLVEALAALPGFSDIGAAQILRRPPPGRSLVWERVPRSRLVARRLS